jgi:hypothetical protein
MTTGPDGVAYRGVAAETQDDAIDVGGLSQISGAQGGMSKSQHRSCQCGAVYNRLFLTQRGHRHGTTNPHWGALLAGGVAIQMTGRSATEHAIVAGFHAIASGRSRREAQFKQLANSRGSGRHTMLKSEVVNHR